MKVKVSKHTFPSMRQEGRWEIRYEAVLEGTPLSATGHSPPEAIGKLIMLHAKQFQFDFELVNVEHEAHR